MHAYIRIQLFHHPSNANDTHIPDNYSPSPHHFSAEKSAYYCSYISPSLTLWGILGALT